MAGRRSPAAAARSSGDEDYPLVHRLPEMHADPGRDDRGSARRTGIRALRPLRERVQRADRAARRRTRRQRVGYRESPPARNRAQSARRACVGIRRRDGSGAGAQNRNPNPSQNRKPRPSNQNRLEPERRSVAARHGRRKSLEFDAVATDVSEIFVAPPDAEHDTGSGNYEAVVLSRGAGRAGAGARHRPNRPIHRRIRRTE